MHVYSNNTGDLMVAHSEADAFQQLCLWNAWEPGDDDAKEADSFERVSDETVLWITFENEDSDTKWIEGLERKPIGKWHYKCGTTAADWVRRMGGEQGVLGSTEC